MVLLVLFLERSGKKKKSPPPSSSLSMPTLLASCFFFWNPESVKRRPKTSKTNVDWFFVRIFLFSQLRLVHPLFVLFSRRLVSLLSPTVWPFCHRLFPNAASVDPSARDDSELFAKGRRVIVSESVTLSPLRSRNCRKAASAAVGEGEESDAAAGLEVEQPMQSSTSAGRRGSCATLGDLCRGDAVAQVNAAQRDEKCMQPARSLAERHVSRPPAPAAFSARCGFASSLGNVNCRVSAP